MIHHVSLGTNDVARAKTFYDAVLATVGVSLMEEREGELIYGGAVFEFSVVRPVDGQRATAGNGVHVAFAAENRVGVEHFYRTALERGGRSDGPPGLRPRYNGNYYGAFVFDPDGNKVEAVTYSAT